MHVPLPQSGHSDSIVFVGVSGSVVVGGGTDVVSGSDSVMEIVLDPSSVSDGDGSEVFDSDNDAEVVNVREAEAEADAERLRDCVTVADKEAEAESDDVTVTECDVLTDGVRGAVIVGGGIKV